MDNWQHVIDEHKTLTRRYFLGLGAAGWAGLQLGPLWAGDVATEGPLAAAIAKLDYLTVPEEFGTVERGNPIPHTLPIEKRREVGLERETWKLEVVADAADANNPNSAVKLEKPLSREAGTALDWAGLMSLAEKHAVRFLKVMTCNNGDTPLGMGLWEGIPLREIIWQTKPSPNVRRLFYYGYHNDDPQQLFQSSLPIGRVLEDPPGDNPVILCYKLNGEFLSGKRGGPVRMLVPEAYGFKSVKWLQRIVLTNNHQANDTYAKGNNDIDSWMKTFARFLTKPTKVKLGEPIPITGVAQVGISGLTKVQYALHPQEPEWPVDDPHLLKADWKDTELLPAPNRWAGGLPNGQFPAGANAFDPATGKPRSWPMRYAIAHWAVVLKDIPAGKYHLRCRTIDANGLAQPMPRPFPKSGRNSIEKASLLVEG